MVRVLDLRSKTASGILLIKPPTKLNSIKMPLISQVYLQEMLVMPNQLQNTTPTVSLKCKDHQQLTPGDLLSTQKDSQDK